MQCEWGGLSKILFIKGISLLIKKREGGAERGMGKKGAGDQEALTEPVWFSTENYTLTFI